MNIVENEQFQVVNSCFPHIGKKIEFLWGDKEFNTFLNRLINDTRDGQRQGFPKPVATALLRLSMLHDTEFPQFVDINTADVWMMNIRPY